MTNKIGVNIECLMTLNSGLQFELVTLNIIFCVATLIFWNLGLPTNLLLLQITKDENLAAHVHAPPHSDMPPECDWLATYAYVHENNLWPTTI